MSSITLDAPAVPRRFSATLLSNAEHCTRLAVLDRANPAGSAPATAGSVFHEAAALVGFYAHARGQETVSPREAIALANRVIRHPSEPAGLARQDANAVRAMIARWSRVTVFDVEADVYEIEVPLVTEIEGQLFSGRADRVTIRGTHCEIHDWKTSRKKVPSQAQVAEHMQLPLYALGAVARWPFLQTLRLVETYVRPSPPVDRDVRVDADDIPSLEEWALDQAGQITAAYEADEFEVTPGAWCANCPAPHTCPIPPEARPESLVQSLDDAIETAGRLLVNRARVDSDERAVKAFLDAHEIPAVFVNGTRVGYTATARRELDQAALAAETGLDLDEFRVAKAGRSFKVD